MTKKRVGQPRPDLQLLSRRLSTSLKAFLNVAKTVAPAWKKEGLKSVRLKGALFVRLNQDSIASAPVVQEEPPTRKNIRARAHVVGVIVTTVSLRDSATRKSIGPGAYLAKLRPKPRGKFDFDFIDRRGRLVLSAQASQSDPGGWAPGFPPILDMRLEWESPAKICLSFLGWEKCWTPRDRDGDGGGGGDPDEGWEGWDPEFPGSSND